MVTGVSVLAVMVRAIGVVLGHHHLRALPGRVAPSSPFLQSLYNSGIGLLTMFRRAVTLQSTEKIKKES